MLVNIHKHTLVIAFILFNYTIVFAQEDKTFSSLKEVLDVAKIKNNSLKNASLQQRVANLNITTSKWNTINPKIPTSLQGINNMKQQLSFLPGQTFGLPQGSYKEVIIGQQYVTTFNIQPQFDIFNLSNINSVKTAKANLQLLENQNKINEQTLFEKINAVYFNILSFQAQKDVISEHLKIAQQIKDITENKFNEGIIRKQDVNEAAVNLILVQDKLEQLETNIKIQYQLLNLFLNNQINSILIESIWDYKKGETNIKTSNNLQTQNAVLQTQVAQLEFKSLKYQNLPVLSFVSSFNWQNLSNKNLVSNNSNWIDYNYVGFKLSYDLPTTVQKVNNVKSKQIQLQILKNNEEQSQKENEQNNVQLVIEYNRYLKQVDNNQKVYLLKKDTYEKSYNQYIENILPLSQLLITQTDLLNSKINVIAALTNIGYYKNKIDINNEY